MRALKIIPNGTVFGKLKVVSFEGTIASANGRGTVSLYLTRCQCGRLRLIRRCNLTSGRSTSCGREKCAQRKKAWLPLTREQERDLELQRHISQAHGKAQDRVKAARPHYGLSNRRLQRFISQEN